MKLKTLILFCSIFGILNLCSQETDKVLLTIDGEPIYTSEFNRVYNKNLNLISSEEQKDVESYLELFINYKLKVKYARDTGLDTLKSYQRELLTYKNQLMEPYLKDEAVVDGLLKEAYVRSTKEIKASHILVRTDQSKDTLVAYNRIYEAYDKLANGASFEEIVLAYSEDPSAKTNKGSLGYFTAFSMVYPFENAAYTTPQGQFSKPFKTRFGYHIVKVMDIRDALGEVEAAHIMVKGDSLASEQKINELYTQLKQGESFEYLAKTQSDDKFSAQKKGNLGKFGTGRMVPEFEKAAFSLQNPGDFSEPFNTRFGWHIVKLVKKYPIQSFEDAKFDLSEKIKRSDRSTIVSTSIVEKLKDEYDIVLREDALEIFESEEIDSSILTDELLTINDKEILQLNLYKYLKRRRLNDVLLKGFIDLEILNYYKENLPKTHPEYGNTYKEYEEGLLLFELLQTKVWDASKDSLAVENYYQKHKANYITPEKMEAVIITSSDKKSASAARKKLKSGIDIEEIKASLNSGNEIKITINEGEFEKTNELIPDSYTYELGLSKVLEQDDRFTIIDLKKNIDSAQESLEDAKGKVISDYQNYIEEEWVNELKETYSVVVNQDVLSSLVSKENE